MMMRFLLYSFVATLSWQAVVFLRTVFVAGQKWHYGTIGIYPADVVACAIALSGMLVYGPALVRIAWRSAVGRAAMAVVVWVMLSALWSGDPALALAMAVRLVLAYVVVLVAVRVQVRMTVVAGVFVGVLVMHALLGLWQFFAQATSDNVIVGVAMHDVATPGTSVVSGDGRWLRAYGGFAHPNIFGGMMALSIILATWCAISARSAWHRALWYGALIVQYCGVLVSFSRTALAACIGGLAILFLLQWRCRAWRALLIPVGALLIVSGGFILAYGNLAATRTVAITEQERNNISERAMQYTQAVMLWRTRPLIGVGARNYTYALRRADADRAPVWRNQPVHNSFMLLGVELGTVGVVLFAFLVFFIARALYYRCSLRDCDGGVVIGIVFAILALFDHWQWDTMTGIYTGALIGIIIIICMRCDILRDIKM